MVLNVLHHPSAKSFVLQFTMPPLSPRQKHAKNFRRRLDGSFWRLRLNHELPSSASREDAPRRQGGLFSAVGRGQTSVRFNIEKIYAKKWVNDNAFYLIQWENFHDLTWEPRVTSTGRRRSSSSSRQLTRSGNINLLEGDDAVARVSSRRAGAHVSPTGVSDRENPPVHVYWIMEIAHLITVVASLRCL
jgi:hypothetical protein